MPCPTNLDPVPAHVAWFNSPATHATNAHGVQTDATCGLHAFNHAMVPFRFAQGLPPTICTREVFEQVAMSSNLGDAPHQLMEPASGNYDVAVPMANFTSAGAAAIPMAPDDIQSRLGGVFSNHETVEGVFNTVAHLLRIPCAGGHWLRALNGSFLPERSLGQILAILCDSLYTAPHRISLCQVEDLITICAYEHAQRASTYEFCPWHCFPIGLLADS